MLVKCYIPSLNRQNKISTHLLLPPELFDWKIVVHDPLQLHQYKQNPTIPPERLVCSYAPRNISAQRNWIKENLFGNDAWAAYMDDNIEAFTAVKEDVYHEENLEKLYPEYFKRNNPGFRKEFYAQSISPARLLSIYKELIAKCEKINTGFAAFSANENYFFSRNKKWKYIQLICSKACLVKNDELRWDENIRTIDDYDYSCQVMFKYGKVLVNAYVWPKAKHNQVGGLGIMSERSDKRIEDCAYMMDKWPDLLKYKERKNSVPGGEIQLRGFGEKFYNKWRAQWMTSNFSSIM